MNWKLAQRVLKNTTQNSCRMGADVALKTSSNHPHHQLVDLDNVFSREDSLNRPLGGD